MTRLENRLSRKELFDIGEAFIDDFIASYNSEPDSIIIDADDTNADTYGAQQLTLFNAYYGEYCYMPLLSRWFWVMGLERSRLDVWAMKRRERPCFFLRAMSFIMKMPASMPLSASLQR